MQATSIVRIACRTATPLGFEWRRTMSLDPSMAVLVVDDFATMSRIIQTLLQQIGITQVEHARDGHSALKALRQKNFSLVISDWNMTPMSGLELLEHIRRDITLTRSEEHTSELQ